MPKLLRDAVHGDIELTPLEVEIIDTPEFQRLRGIKQLGTAYLVYPSATHTRFEHSIGAAWMAHRLVAAVRRNRAVGSGEELLIAAAALVHDVTHIPFGHTLEDERRVLPRHDQDDRRLRYFLVDSAIGEVLARHGIRDEVLQILTGKGTLASDIVAGAVSADLLDYLRRDNYFTGLSQHYDSRVLHLFEEDGGRLILRLEKNGVLRRDALSEVVHLLRIRYTLSERVYFHHTKLASGAMISRAVELALAEGLDPDELCRLGDETLIWTLARRFSGTRGVAHIIECLTSRRLYKPAYVLTVDVGPDHQQRLESLFHYDPAERALAEEEIAREAGLGPHEVIVYCPALGMSLPEAEVPVMIDAGGPIPLSGANNSEIRILKEKHRALWKFLVLVDRSRAFAHEAVAGAAAAYVAVPRMV
jgi:hypothetical protein